MKRLFSALLFCLSIHFCVAQSFNISGTIKSLNNSSVSGANVSILNTNHGTSANSDGSFEILNIPSGNYTLRISAVGYATVLQKIKPINNENVTLNIELQSENKSLDEVVVTAQKTEEQAQRIPVAITTISSKQVQDYRLWNSKDISAIVPNLYSGNSGDERNVTSIRGITSTSYDPAVSTYIDGVNQFSLDTYIPQLIDVERIEVLRGPQGTLYGRNAMGGVINIITKQPTNKISGFVETNFGSKGQQRYAIGFKAPLIKDKLYIGIAGLFEHRDGFYNNDYTNSGFEQFQNATGNYFLKYSISNKWTLSLNIKHSHNRNKGAFPLSFGVEDSFKKPFIVNQNAIAKTIDNTINTSLTVNHYGNYFNFNSITAYQSNYRYYDNPIDGDFNSLDMLTISNNYGDKWNKSKAVTQEFKISSPTKNNKLNWTLGSYLFYQQSPVKQASNYGLYAKLLGAPDSSFSTINTSNSFNAGAALFGQLMYSFNKKLDLTLGIRYDYEHKRQSVLGEYQKGNFTIPTQADTVSSANFQAISPKVSLIHHPTENNHIYVSYARGFRAGGLLNDPSTPLYVYKPEFSNNFELGFKNNFLDNRLLLNLTGFFITINNAQTPTLILPQALTVTRNSGNVESKGVELEFLVKPVKGLQIDYNFGYNDAKYKSLKLPNDSLTAEKNYNGNQQIFTPSHTSMLAVQYTYNIGGIQNLQLIARVEWRSLGKQYFDLKNTISQDAYNIFNTRFGVSAKNFEVMLWGRNLSNQKYIEYAYSFGGIHLGNPYNYGVTLSGRF